MKKGLPAIRFILVSALSVLLLALTACTGCRRDKPVGTDPAEDTARQSASPVPAEITREPAEKATPAPGIVTEPEITGGAIYLPPIPVDDPDDEFESMPEPTGEPEPTREPEPTQEHEPTQEPAPEPGQTEESAPTPKPDENETPLIP